MQHSNDKKRFAASLSLAVALGLLAATGGQSAQAGINYFNPDPAVSSTANLGPGTVTTDAYPAGDPFTLGPQGNPGPIFGIVPTTFSVAAGSNLLTFTAPGNSGGFINTPNTDPDTKLPLYAISSPNVLETVNLTGAIGLPQTGPLEIDFQQGVTGFGLSTEDYSKVFETFTVTAYNGVNPLGTPFTTPVFDSTGDPSGAAVFLGAQTTGGDLITKIIISSTSQTMLNGMLTDSGDGNDFVFGPVTVMTPASGAPVPEASTVISSGFGLLLFGGLFLWGKRKATA
jgi:hypothetical protein